MAVLLFVCMLAISAEPPTHVEICVEVFELPQPQAFSIQKMFVNGPDAERNRALGILRGNPAVKGTRSIAMGQWSCKPGGRSVFQTCKEYKYPTQYHASVDETPAPVAFEMRQAGTIMEVEVSNGQNEGLYALNATITTTELSGKLSNPSSDTLRPPFVSSRIATQLDMTAGVPKLLGMYAPHPDLKAGPVLRVVIATIRPAD